MTRDPGPRSPLFWKFLPWPARARLLLGVFLLFASSGFFVDLFQVAPDRPLGVVLLWCAYGGAVAAAYAWIGLSRSRRWIPVVLVLQYVAAGALPRTPETAPAAPVEWAAEAQRRVRFDAICGILLVTGGYAVLIRFIWGEGGKHVQLRTEVDLAQRIHERIVPPIVFASSRLEVLGRADASDEIGGDLVDGFALGDRYVACVADVAGHGIAAGTLAAMMKSALRMRLLAGGSLAEALADLNRLVIDLERPGTFVTLALLAFEPGHPVAWALAGHPPILHWRAGHERATHLPNPNLPLGVDAGATFTSATVEAGPGDLFALYTDGLMEVEDRARVAFEIDGIERVLAPLRERPLAEAAAALLSAVRAHGAQDDDQTLCLVRVLTV